MLGSLNILATYHMSPYSYLANDYATQLSLLIHHMWTSGSNVLRTLNTLLIEIKNAKVKACQNKSPQSKSMQIFPKQR